MFTKLRNEEQDPTTKSHVNHFYRVMDKELRDVIDRKNDLVAKGVITHELIWAIMEPGDVINPSSGGPLRAFLHSNTMVHDTQSFVESHVTYVECNAIQGHAQITLNLPFFEDKPITSLPFFPLKYHPEKTAVEESLVARGRKWEAHNGIQFKAYDGSPTSTEYCEAEDEDSNTKHERVMTRVVLDTHAYK
jgi:hypothetical protein